MASESVTVMPDIEAPSNPFPGLRPFEFDESHLFFGRDGQSEQLLRKLSGTRFVVVVGTSGSGKSSLVRAGLLPDLYGGFISSAGSNWRVAVMRPSNDPLGNLSAALAAQDVFGSETKENAELQATIIEATLRRGSLGLIEAARQHRMPANENLLVVVDQFEELFRFARVSRDAQYHYEAASFVKLLLEATRQKEFNIYVVLTMRSDFLGDCSLFWELPEAINEGQYLIPRLTRDQRREAITGPVAVCGGEMTERLVNRLLNDMGDDADQLPILQHALMRTWNKWKDEGEQGPLDLVHYEAIGAMEEALSRHADEAYNELPDERSREIVEKIFKGLTEKGADNREIRRPVTLKELCALAGADAQEVKAVIEIFRREGRTFLMPPPPLPLDEDSLIDISHESLIRNWQRLKEWVDEEAVSAQIYLRLAETAALYERGEAGLWRDPDLQIALNWRKKNQPDEVWASRYHTGFAASMKFLDQSVAARDAELQEAERRRKKELKRARLTALIFAIAFIFALAVLTYAVDQRNVAREKSAVATQALAEAQKARADADRQKLNAVSAAQDAALQARRAEEESDKATEEKKRAEQQTKIAEEQKIEAEHAKSKAQVQARIAEENRTKAELAQKDAEEQRGIAVAEGKKAASALEKNTRLLYAADLNLAQQAYEANNVRRGLGLLDAHGPSFDPNVEPVSTNASEIFRGGLAGFEYYYLWRLFHGESDTLPGNTAAVNSVAFSPDGKIIASGSNDGTLKLWDTSLARENNKTVKVVEKGGVKTIAFSPDGQKIALAGGGGEVKLLSTASTGNSGVTSLKLPDELRNASITSLSNIAFSPDGKTVAVGIGAAVKNSRSMTHRVLLWKTETGQLVADLEGHKGFINAIAFSPGDCSCFATASSDNTVKVWDTDPSRIKPRSDGTKYRYEIRSDSPAQALALSHDANTLAVGYQDGTVRLWPFSYYLNVRAVSDAMRTAPLASSEQKSAVSSLSFTRDDKIIAAGKEDGTIQLWAKEQPGDSYQAMTIFKSHTDAVTSLAFSPDGQRLASGSQDRTVRLWDTGPQIFKLLPLPVGSAVSTMTLSADGKTLAVVSIDGMVKLCGTDTTRKCVAWSRPTGATKSIAFSPDGKLIATSDQNNKVEVWRIGSSNEAPVTLDGHKGIVNRIAFSPDGQRLATYSLDKTIRLWDVATGSQGKILPQDEPVQAMTFSPDGNMLAVSSVRPDGGSFVTLRLLNSDAVSIKLDEGADAVASRIAFSPDGKMLAAGTVNGYVHLWNIASLESSNAKSWAAGSQKIEKLPPLEGHAGAVNSVAFSPDGRTLATGGNDRTIKLWSVGSQKELITLQGHKSFVTCVVFAPDGRWLASGSYDNTVRFWYAATVDDYLSRARPGP